MNALTDHTALHPIIDEDLDAIVARLQPVAAEISGKTILIVGGMGFLGRHFRAIFERMGEKLLAKPCRLIVIDSLITSSGATNVVESDPLHVFMKHDIREPFRILEQVDYVIHCAGVASPYYYRQFPVETIEVATLGTKNALELARQNKARLLYFSSSEIYGDPVAGNVPTREDYRGNVACLGPRACYDESKRMGETMCHVYAQYFDTHATIVRPFNVYGPGMRETDYRVLPNFANAIKGGRPLPIYASGRQTRTYCYLADAMVGFVLALLRGRTGEPYNIGNPDPEISVLDLAKIVREVTGCEAASEKQDYPATYPADEPQRRCPDISKARSEFGYVPQVDLRTGLTRFFKWTQSTYNGEQLT